MKKLLIILITTIFLLIGILIVNKIINTNTEKKESNVITQEVGSTKTNNEAVTDDCADEWEDYNRYIGEKIEEASTNYSEDDTHYLLKDVWGYIEVYYLDDDNKEYLYKKTSIATDYLAQEDIDDLKIGIEVVGAEAMNKMLEDFE